MRVKVRVVTALALLAVAAGSCGAAHVAAALSEPKHCIQSIRGTASILELPVAGPERRYSGVTIVSCVRWAPRMGLAPDLVARFGRLF